MWGKYDAHDCFLRSTAMVEHGGHGAQVSRHDPIRHHSYTFMQQGGRKKEEGVQDIVFARPLLALVYSRGVI